MIFKVYYQDTMDEYPIRERTKSLFLEADSIRDVRKKLANHGYNIEHIQQMDEVYLSYEQQSSNFELESV